MQTPVQRDSQLAFALYDAWLAPAALAAIGVLDAADLAHRQRAAAPPAPSRYLPGEGRHVSHLHAEALAIATTYLDDLVARLRVALPNPIARCDWWFERDGVGPARSDAPGPAWTALLFSDVAIRGRGGELVLASAAPAGGEAPRSDSVSPCTNRLVAFSGHTTHGTLAFHGRLVALVVELWDAAGE